jgi:hypothetical protein
MFSLQMTGADVGNVALFAVGSLGAPQTRSWWTWWQLSMLALLAIAIHSLSANTFLVTALVSANESHTEDLQYSLRPQ